MDAEQWHLHLMPKRGCSFLMTEWYKNGPASLTPSAVMVKLGGNPLEGESDMPAEGHGVG